MPELPEVETMIRGIRDSVLGAKLLDLELLPCPRKDLAHNPEWDEMQKMLVGTQLERIVRRGKRIILCFVNEQKQSLGLVIEPRMTGLLLTDQSPDPLYLRFCLHFSPLSNKVQNKGKKSKLRPQTATQNTEKVTVWYWDRRGLGVVRLLHGEKLEEMLYGNQIGKDALEMTLLDWTTLLHTSRQPMKTLLLDQKKVAGIGNLYASEILYAAGIHPETTGSQLRSADVQKLLQSTQDILSLAIEYEGSTLSDGTYRNALNNSGRYQNEHRVYQKEGENCLRCKRQVIVRVVQAQRSTFYCPGCQKKKKS